MDDQKIKSAMKSQLDSLEMDKQLKEKTLRYIMNEKAMLTSRLSWRWMSSGLGFIAVCLIAFILIPKVESTNHSLNPISTLTDDLNVNTRQVGTPLDTLKMVMDQLNLTYRIGTPHIETSYTVTPIIVDDVKGYYVELSTTVDNFDVCSQTSLQVIRLGEKSLFLYADVQDELVESLIANYTILCK